MRFCFFFAFLCVCIQELYNFAVSINGVFMKILLLILVSIALFTGCDSRYKKSIDKTFSDGKPAKISVMDTVDGRNDTISKVEYWPNGNRRIEGGYKNNLRDGEWTYWFENGKVWSKGSFKDGLSEGKFQIYNEDGTRYLESSYKMGKPDGCWTFFDKNKKKKEVYFENNKMLRQVDY
jgi:antitoxin component YwqK of YwqJK toxin-antitoxin module